MQYSYFLIWSSLAWSRLWAGFTLHTIFRLSSLFFFTMSDCNKVWSFSYSSSHLVNTSKQVTHDLQGITTTDHYLHCMKEIRMFPVYCTQIAINELLPFQILHGWCASIFLFPKPLTLMQRLLELYFGQNVHVYVHIVEFFLVIGQCSLHFFTFPNYATHILLISLFQSLKSNLKGNASQDFCNTEQIYHKAPEKP